jgi:hypothetical protein
LHRLPLLSVRVCLFSDHFSLTVCLLYHCRTKIILHALICNFEFTLAMAAEDVGRKDGIVTRPMLKSQPEQGVQLPLVVKRVPEDEVL